MRGKRFRQEKELTEDFQEITKIVEKAFIGAQTSQTQILY